MEDKAPCTRSNELDSISQSTYIINPAYENN